LDDESIQHFDEFKSYLNYLNIPYHVDHKLVRGLDYYNRTVFEWTTNDLGSQGAICAGGRYDGLVETMGGTPTPGIGFAIGIERIILLLQQQGVDLSKTSSIYIVSMGNEAQLLSMKMAEDLHKELPEVILYNDISIGNLKNQLKRANKADADYALIIGNDEISNNQVSIKPLKGQGKQTTINPENLVQYFKENL
jgi:histidyl-tRNA synthetase